MDNMRSSIPAILLITIGVIGSVVGFYFWETYLLTHYLGGYNEYGLPVQHSYPGFYFFLYAWPLWLFPVFVLLVIMSFFQWYRVVKSHKKRQVLTEALVNKEVQIEELREELRTLKNKFDKIKGYSLLQEEYRQLEDEFFALQKDYERSLNFIEKLLEKIPPSENLLK
ncbi:hypothetical protein [Legionella nagasakiensis]|uniref:hypothetical protein n=1 Tax=Legionella nagasakiensis TaxID=535290 RepID=UPI0010561560|nr:hypothetical protein [Legionella nagasakiensis]